MQLLHKRIRELISSSGVVSRFIMAIGAFCAVNLVCWSFLSLKGKSAQVAIRENGSNLPMSQTFTGWTARAFLRQPKPADVVLLGSSQMGSAVFSADASRLNKVLDCLIHRRAACLEIELSKRLGHPVAAFNWALGGEMVSDAYMISKALFDGKWKPKLVVIGVSPRDFIDNSLQCAGATEPFQFFLPYIRLRDLAAQAFPDPCEYLGWEINDRLPIRRLRDERIRALTQSSDVVLKLAPNGQFLRTISGGTGAVRQGDWLIAAKIPPMLVDNTKEYQHRFHNPRTPLYGAELKFFEELLGFLEAEDVKVLVVGMPSLWPNRALLPDEFWVKWRSNMYSMCNRPGVRWIDLTDSSQFDCPDFLDTVHMNAQGGAKLFEILADTIYGDSHLASALVDVPRPRKIAGAAALNSD